MVWSPGITDSFVNVRTAGDPDQPDFKSIDFSPAVISEELAAMGTPVSPPVIRAWLVKNGFALHKMAKVLAGGRSPFLNAQFEKINDFKHMRLDIISHPTTGQVQAYFVSFPYDSPDQLGWSSFIIANSNKKPILPKHPR